jgi:YidC/Oxa1 family membrane protein insertase
LDDPRTFYWNLIIVHPLERGLTFLASDLGLGAGLAIILFTIIIRLILLPLTIQQLKSSRALQRLQPEIKALQKKHSGDREKIAAEQMALYREHGVNPAMGCLPLVLQMPVLFGLYAALSNLGAHNEVFQAPWLWLSRLDQPDVLVLGGVTLPFILPVLAAVTQWVQQRMMTPQTDDPQQRLQNQMMQFMPLMMLWFGLSFSSGLALYWVTQNLVGIVQQYFYTGWGSLLPNRASTAVAVASDTRATEAGRRDGAGEAAPSGREGGRDAARDGGRPVSRSGGRGGQRGAGRGGGGARDDRGGSGSTTSRLKGEGRRTSGKR